MHRSTVALALFLVLAGSSAEARVAKGSGPTGIVTGYGSVWVGSGDGTVTRIDERTGRVIGRTDLGEYTFVHDMDVGFGSVWVAPGRSSLARVDAGSGRVTEIERVLGGWTPSLLEVGAGAVWVGDGRRNAIFRLDPRTNRITAAVRTRGRLWGLEAGSNGVWVVEVPGRGRLTGPRLTRVVRRLDPRSVRFNGRKFEVWCDVNLASGAREVWMLNTCSGRLQRLEPFGRAVETGGHASGIAVGTGSVWVGRNGSVRKVDRRGARVEATIPVRVSDIAVGRRGVWTLEMGDGTHGWLRLIDPATNRVVGKPIRVPPTKSQS